MEYDEDKIPNFTWKTIKCISLRKVFRAEATNYKIQNTKHMRRKIIRKIFRYEYLLNTTIGLPKGTKVTVTVLFSFDSSRCNVYNNIHVMTSSK